MGGVAGGVLECAKDIAVVGTSPERAVNPAALQQRALAMESGMLDNPRASKPSPRNEAGFSLVELLVTVVVMLVVLGVIGQVMVRSDIVFRQQRQHLDRRFSVATTLDTVVRLLRQAETVTTDPDGNGILDSVEIVADWNPRNGDTSDPYEAIEFSVAGNTLFKREPADAAPIAFADGVTGLTFAYFNPAGGAV